MKEIKFLKDLPCKLLNKNKNIIKLLGGDVYYDKDGNRFAFLTFENTNKSPIFFLQLALREYSGDGKLLQDEEFVLPNIFYPKGEFVNEVPIEINKETEAVEVYITKATFDHVNYVNDSLKPFKEEDYASKPSRAPKKKWDAKSTFSFSSIGREEVKPTSAVTPTSTSTPTPSTVVEDREVREEAKRELIQGSYKKVNLRLLYFIPLALVVIAGIITFLSITTSYIQGVVQTIINMQGR